MFLLIHIYNTIPTFSSLDTGHTVVVAVVIYTPCKVMQTQPFTLSHSVSGLRRGCGKWAKC